MKLGVFIPWTSPFMFSRCVDSVWNLQRPPDVEIRFFRGKGWCSARRHADGCEQAIAWGADIILCLGADQTYPEDLIQRLLARHYETNGDAIAALVPFRGYMGTQPMEVFQPLAWRIKSDDGRAYRGMDKDPEMLHQIKSEDGDLQEVNVIGSGVLMFRKEHLLALKKPWFFEQVDRESYRLTGDMDAMFVWRLQVEAHVKIWVDTTIKVEHLNIFPIDETYQNRFSDWKDGGGDPEICRYPKIKQQERA